MGKTTQVGRNYPSRGSKKGKRDQEVTDSIARMERLKRGGSSEKAASRIVECAESAHLRSPKAGFEKGKSRSEPLRAHIRSSKADFGREEIRSETIRARLRQTKLKSVSGIPKSLEDALINSANEKCNCDKWPYYRFNGTVPPHSHCQNPSCRAFLPEGQFVCGSDMCHKILFWGSEIAAKSAQDASKFPKNKRGREEAPKPSGRPRENRRPICKSEKCFPPSESILNLKDERLIDNVPFALNSALEKRDEDASKIRKLLKRCGVKKVGDILGLGCTAVVHFGLTLEEGRFIISGLAGCGIGLTCVVPKNRFCWVHQVLGPYELDEEIPYKPHLKEMSVLVRAARSKRKV